MQKIPNLMVSRRVWVILLMSLCMMTGCIRGNSAFRSVQETIIATPGTLPLAPNAEKATSVHATSALAKVRQKVSYQVFVPTSLPMKLKPEQPIIGELNTPGIRIQFRDSMGQNALLVLNGPAGCCLDSDSSKIGRAVKLANGNTAHLLKYIEPQYGGPILWWVQEGTYIALSSSQLSIDNLIQIASSMSKDADLQ